MNHDDDNTRSFVALGKGTMVSHYRIAEKIGAGGMGEVYLAEDTKLRRQVALKFMPVHTAADADLRERFTREAQAAAQLDHPNIVPVYEVGEHQGRPYFVMAHIKGRPLRDVIKQGKLSTNEAVRLTMQICEGLHKAHEAGVVHRDVKPGNIIIDNDGRARLLDFGLAMVSGEEKLTKTGSTLGTVGYMSPEQISGAKVDQRSDLFSVGVILYEMLTGRHPFEGDNDAAIVNAITSSSPEPIARFKSGVAGELQQVVDKALSKDPALRYQHADGIISDLKRLIARTETSITVTPAKQKSWWYLAMVGGIVLGALVIQGIRYWPLDDPSRAESMRQERKTMVVLPFENLGNPDDEYFADGITDEITAKLASIRALRVTSRTSAMQYKQTEKSLKQIGKELGVDYVLEGTIRWDKSGDTNRVRITPQLIQVSDDSHVWANTYERSITQIFSVQADIATQIAGALNIALQEPEQVSIEAEPTQNIEAYQYYLRGLELSNSRPGTGQSIVALLRAVELDTSFYQAYALLAQIYGFRHINSMCGTEPCCELAEEAAEAAFRLADGLPNGDMGLGYYHYYCSRDYELALELFGTALESQPSNVELMRAIGYVYRRSGQWEESLEMLRQAYQLSPATYSDIHNLVTTVFNMHQLGEAQKLIDGILELDPENYAALGWKVALTWVTTGDTVQTIEAGKLLDRYSPRPFSAYWSETYDLAMRCFRSAIGRRETPGSYIFADSAEFYLNRGYAYGQLNEPDLSHAYYDSALIVAEQWGEGQPGNVFNMMGLAEAYAGLGRKEEALQTAEAAALLLPVSIDALLGAQIKSSLADIYAMVGEHATAIDLLEWLISNPSPIQIVNLRMDAAYDPLRDHPRFVALLEKYDNQ